MAILSIAFTYLFTFGNTQRKGLNKSHKNSRASQIAITYTERQKSWFSDTSKTAGLTKFRILYTALAATTVDSNWTDILQGGATCKIRIQYSRTGNTVDSLIKARGTVTWDSVSPTNKHTYTWGLAFTRPH